MTRMALMFHIGGHGNHTPDLLVAEHLGQCLFLSWAIDIVKPLGIFSTCS